MTFSAHGRAASLADLAGRAVDVLVIGGGVTGAGVLLDAASRGLRAALVERGDFASGTSSKSSKLIHGGVRYLRQREFGLVHEALEERHRLLRNAPHLVEEVTFLVPIIAAPGDTKLRLARAYKQVMSAGLWLYDAIGGWRVGRIHKRAKPSLVMELMPALDRDRVVGGYLYVDARADDARLTLSVVKTAVHEYGATAINYAPATALLVSDGHVTGATVRDAVTGTSYDVHAKTVVNAAGVWSDQVRALAGPDPRSIRPAKGVHITVPWKRLPVRCAAVLQVTGDDRAIFVIPWDHHVYVGTTDTDYRGDLDDPQCNANDVQYLLDAVNACVAEPLTPTDVTATWAGLRPLISDANSDKTADLSRRHTVRVDDGGLVTVTGGKLTTYRRMAEDTVDTVLDQLGMEPVPSPTAELSLYGAEHEDARAIQTLVEQRPELGAPIVAGLDYTGAQAVFAVRHEMAVTLDDVLSRRTRALLLDRHATEQAARAVAELIAPDLEWDTTEIDRQVAAFTEICARESDAERVVEQARP